MSLLNTPSQDQIKRLPKALLHDHLDGGLRPQTLIEIADRIGYKKLPTNDPIGGISPESILADCGVHSNTTQ